MISLCFYDSTHFNFHDICKTQQNPKPPLRRLRKIQENMAQLSFLQKEGLSSHRTSNTNLARVSESELSNSRKTSPRDHQVTLTKNDENIIHSIQNQSRSRSSSCPNTPRDSVADTSENEDYELEQGYTSKSRTESPAVGSNFNTYGDCTAYFHNPTDNEFDWKIVTSTLQSLKNELADLESVVTSTTCTEFVDRLDELNHEMLDLGEIEGLSDSS